MVLDAEHIEMNIIYPVNYYNTNLYPPFIHAVHSLVEQFNNKGVIWRLVRLVAK